MDRWRENAGKVVELPPMDGWREVVAVNAGGRVVARYWGRHETWDEVIVVLLEHQAIRSTPGLQLVKEEQASKRPSPLPVEPAPCLGLQVP